MGSVGVRRWLGARLPLLALAACADEPGSRVDLGPGDPPPTPTDAVTWNGAARDVVDRHCVGCHTDGGSGGFALDSWAAASPRADALVDAVDAGRMPLWPPDPSCRPIVGERVMPEADKAVLRAWAAAGAPEGATDGRPPAVPAPALLEDFTHRADTAGFVPNLALGDVHWCYPFADLTFEEETFATAHQAIPGSSVVHHVSMFVLTPKLQRKYEDLDLLSPEPGFPCAPDDWLRHYGADPEHPLPDKFPPPLNANAPVVGGPELVEYPDAVALPFAAGSQVALVVHYSALAGSADADTTEVRLRMSATPPERIVLRESFENRDVWIPAGEPSVTVTASWPYWGAEPVWFAGGGGHMHLLGASFLAETVAPDGATTCVLALPAFDPDHLGVYLYPEDDPPAVPPGHRMQVTCVYDNSPANQPVIDGVPREPPDVGWGKETEDEMCLFTGGYLAPYRPPIPEGEGACYRQRGCAEACAGGPAEVAACEQACAEQDPGCGKCFRNAALDCEPPCPSRDLKQSPCWDDCVAGYDRLGGSLAACLASQCPAEAATWQTCVEALSDGTACEKPAARCGLRAPEPEPSE